MELTQEQKLKKELEQFNFGAFGLSWIWGIFNGCFKQTSPALILSILAKIFPQWTSLVVFILFFFGVYCGLNGNKWSYYNKKWGSLERFIKIQRYWAIATLIVILGTIITIITLSAFFIKNTFKDPIRMMNQIMVMAIASEKNFKDGNDIANKLVENDNNKQSSSQTKTELYNDNSIILTGKSGNQTVFSFYKDGKCSLKQKNCYMMYYDVKNNKLIHKATTYFDEFGKSEYVPVK